MDHLLDIVGDRHCVMGNPKWPLRLCIYNCPEKGPFLLTCRYHDGGSDLMYLHPPMNPMNRGFLPAPIADQIGSIQMVSRTLKTAKKRSKCYTFGVSSAQYTYNGVDSFLLGWNSRFDCISTIAGNDEALALYSRPDLRANLDDFESRDIISRSMKEIMLDEAEQLVQDENDDFVSLRGKRQPLPFTLSAAKASATYVPLADVLEMHKASSRSIVAYDTKYY